MATTIFYIVDVQNKQFYFFLDYKKCKEKETELGLVESDFKDKMLIPRCPMTWITLKNFYGTVWLAWKQLGKGLSFKIVGRMRDLSTIYKTNNYQIKKFVLQEYEECVGKEHAEKVREFGKTNQSKIIKSSPGFETKKEKEEYKGPPTILP